MSDALVHADTYGALAERCRTAEVALGNLEVRIRRVRVIVENWVNGNDVQPLIASIREALNG